MTWGKTRALQTGTIGVIFHNMPPRALDLQLTGMTCAACARSIDEARRILAKAPGVKLVDDVKHSLYPMPIEASGQYDVRVGRIRRDASVEHGLALFVAGDNIWKGAAQNAIQIAEALIGK